MTATTAKAAISQAPKQNPPFVTLSEIPIREPTAGEAVIDILATHIRSYASEILDGTRVFPKIFPSVPGTGAVGRIRSIGPGSTVLRPGQLVIFDPTIRARDDAVAPAAIISGLLAPGPAGESLQSVWLNGSWAEKMVAPVENLIPVPPSVEAKVGISALSNIAGYAIVYGGLRDSGLRAGHTIAITGSTGPFGGSAVAIALAMGARRVIASGRNLQVLESYVAKFGPRVYPVVATGDEAKDTANFQKAVGEGFHLDVTFDMLPETAPFSTARAAISALKFGGTAILMGGEHDSVELPYRQMTGKNLTVKGVFMNPLVANVEILGMIDAGLLDPTLLTCKEFKLEQVEEAVQWAKTHAGPFDMTVLKP
ncbi:hypothetical protein EMPS_08802 [Entomortierella parvispora]|uniref:Alcohol dehydrogenase n=1 Tax=Entomortierella parvispora TaxID=205924 RepID=A0A9P3HHC0_9FUNG|nr:hypothetical protein EMPS_08802 [Entomortierella parvispora]